MGFRSDTKQFKTVMNKEFLVVDRSQFRVRILAFALLSILTGLWGALVLASMISATFISGWSPWFQIVSAVIVCSSWVIVSGSFKQISTIWTEDKLKAAESFAQRMDSKGIQENGKISSTLEEFATCRHEKLTSTLRELHVLITSHLNSVTNETNDAALNLIDQLKLIYDAMSHLLDKVSENRRASDQMATGSQSTLIDNQNTMTRLQTYINSRLQEIDHDHQMASELQEQALIMSDLTKLIESISKQTTIVATNAKIEAFRAGVHGQAFGVIADEVTKLSAQIGDSSKQIIQSIDQMGKSIEEKFKIKLDKSAKQEETNLLNSLKDQLANMGKSYTQLEDFNRETLADINTSSEHIKAKVNDSLMAIQFQDITQQQIEIILKSLHLFEEHLSGQPCIDLVGSGQQGDEEFDIEKIRKLYVMKKQHDIHDKHHRMKQLNGNRQKDSDSSDITLF